MAGGMRGIIVAPFVIAACVTAGCSRQESAWQDAARRNTPAAYQEYLDRYPRGAHAADARAGIVTAQEAAAWARAERLETPEAWQRYLADWPQGAHAPIARRSLVEFIPPPPAAPGGFEIQLGAWSDEASARTALAGWAGRQADLGGQVPRVDGPKPGAPPVWRLRAGPYDEAAARVVCDDLKSAGVDCVAVAAGSAGDAPP
jgi:hypothetical protein